MPCEWLRPIGATSPHEILLLVAWWLLRVLASGPARTQEVPSPTMALTTLDEAHFETGEAEAMFTNVDPTPPNTVEVVSTGDVDDGTFCLRMAFTSSSRDWNSEGSLPDRAAALTPLLAQWTCRFDTSGGGVWDRSMLYVYSGASSTLAVIGLIVLPDGSFTVRTANASGSLQTGAVIASAAAGSIPINAKAVISMRVVFDNSSGECQVRVNGAEVVNVTGVDTNGSFGTIQNSNGQGLVVEVGTLTNPFEFRLANATFAADDTMANLPEWSYQGITPDGVTADNNGTVFGGAADAAQATDELPGTSADGFTLDAASDRQGLTFPTPSVSNVDAVFLYGQVGDSSAGSEEVVIEYSDGVSTDTSAAIAMTNDFVGRQLHKVETPPGAASFDAAAANHVFTIERTA